MYSKKSEKFNTVFVNENLNSNVNPLSILNKQCHVKFALKIESIYIGTKISLQVKLCEVLFRPKENVLRSLLAPTAVIRDVSLLENEKSQNVENEVVEEHGETEEEHGDTEEEQGDTEEEQGDTEEEEEEQDDTEEEEEDIEEVIEEVKPVPIVKKEVEKPVRKTRAKKSATTA